MDSDRCVALIKEGLGYRKDRDDTIRARLQEAQEYFQGGAISLPWFIINEDSPIPLLDGVSEYTLSDKFIREVNDEGQLATARSVNGDVYHVRKYTYDKAVAMFGQTEEEAWPRVYAIRANKLKFFPTPDQDYDYRWSFYQKQTDLSGGNVSDADNAWLKNCPYLLIGYAGKETAKTLRDQAAITLFSEMEAKWTRWLSAQMTARDEANISYVMGADQ